MTSRPSSSWSASQSQPARSRPSALVLHSRSIQARPETSSDSAPTRTVPRAGMRVKE